MHVLVAVLRLTESLDSLLARRVQHHLTIAAVWVLHPSPTHLVVGPPHPLPFPHPQTLLVSALALTIAYMAPK